jgi:type I restriction enzyme S subunit
MNNWRKDKLFNVADVKLSNVDKKTLENEMPIQLCNYTDVYKNSFVDKCKAENFMHASCNQNEYEKFVLKSGQVAITKDSEKSNDIGIPTYICDSLEHVVLGYHLSLITPIKDKLDGKFLKYYLETNQSKKYFENNASGSGQRFFLALDTIKDIPLFLPQINIQKKISNLLFNIDSKIELNNKLNKELDIMAKTIYDYWFVQFDFPNEEGNPYKSSGGKMEYHKELKREIPYGWKVSELKKLVKIERGISYKSTDIDSFSGCPMINLNSFYLDGSYKPEGIKYFKNKYSDNKVVKSGDLIIATTDVTRNADIIGKATIVPDIYEGDILLSCDIARIVYDDSLDKYFLEKLFNSSFYHEYIKGFASGTLVLHLNTNGIEWYKTFIPPKRLLHNFSNLMKPIQRKKELVTLENYELVKLRDWLLPMLMNGQVKVA